jgi:hypothetical protein
MLWGEGSADFAMDVLHGKIIHFNLWRGFVPMFSAVYHDYWTFFGRSMPINPVLDTSRQQQLGEISAGWLFTIGAQIGRVIPEDYNAPTATNMIHYLAKLTEVKGNAYEFLSLGRMMRPPIVDLKTIPVIETYLKGPVKMPAIMASVWKSPDGKLALAVTNAALSTVSTKLILDLNEYDMPQMPSYKLYELGHNGDPNYLICDSNDKVLKFMLSVNSFDAKVYVLANPVTYSRQISESFEHGARYITVANWNSESLKQREMLFAEARLNLLKKPVIEMPANAPVMQIDMFDVWQNGYDKWQKDYEKISLNGKLAIRIKLRNDITCITAK